MGAITRGFANNILSSGTVDATDGLTGTIPASNINNTSVSAITSMPATVGDFVQSVASDPSPASEGDVWYNSTTGSLKSLVALAAWSSGSPLITARENLAGAGTQTAALAFGGYEFVTTTEKYNGTSWSANPTGLNTGRFGLSSNVGTQTAGLTFGGQPPTTAASESFNGTSWTNTPSLNTARSYAAGCGIQTAALAVGGTITPGPVSGATESYNGSTWTSSPSSLNTSRSNSGMSGTQTSAIYFFGRTPPSTYYTSSETWDGTSWVSGPSGANSKSSFAYVGNTLSSALSAGGYDGANNLSTSEEFTGETVAANLKTVTTS